ncbi:MAG: DNA N-6-adenine-methyltransferase, partial [Alloalcanivorax venustensis]
MTICHATGGSTLWATPDDFIAGVKGIYGPIALDCAAVRDTSKGEAYYGPDHAVAGLRDALTIDWVCPAGLSGGLRWLNPEYGRGITAAWMAKASIEGQR